MYLYKYSSDIEAVLKCETTRRLFGEKGYMLKMAFQTQYKIKMCGTKKHWLFNQVSEFNNFYTFIA